MDTQIGKGPSTPADGYRDGLVAGAGRRRGSEVFLGVEEGVAVEEVVGTLGEGLRHLQGVLLPTG